MKWIRFSNNNADGFGTLDGDKITVYTGSLFGDNEATSETLSLSAVVLLPPCQPGKLIAIWNNYHALAEKQGNDIPDAPFYLIKPSTCVIGTGENIVRPAVYDGRIMYEGELGVVIGKHCKSVEESEAANYIKGYTCVNDVTAFPIIQDKPEFQQWVRAKSFDTFGVVGPCIAELPDPNSVTITTRLNGRERQNYSSSDMILPPARLVSLLSQDMTLEPGDVIACGTSLGVLPLKNNAVIEVEIEGVGCLSNTFVG